MSLLRNNNTQMPNHVVFPNQPNLQPQQGQQNFQPNQIRPQPQLGQQQLSQQFMGPFASLPAHIQQRVAAQHNIAPQQLLQMAQQQQQQQDQHQMQAQRQQQQQQQIQQRQQQQQQQQLQNQPAGQQVRPNANQQSPTFSIQPATNRFQQPPGQAGGQFSGQQINQNQPLTNQMQAAIAQNPQLYQQRLLQQHQQHLAQSGSPPSSQPGLSQPFQGQPQHPGVSQLSNQSSAETQRSPAMRNLQGPKSTNSPHQTPRSIPPSTPQHQMQLQSQSQQTPQQIVPQQSPASQPRQGGGKESFMQSLYDFMIRRGTPIQSTPFIGSRQIDLFTLYVTVMKESGFQAATNKGAWGRVAVQNNLPGGDTAIANQLAELYKVYLLPFEEAFQKAQAVRRQQLASNQGRPPTQQGQPQQPLQPQMQPAPHTPQQPHQPPPILPDQTPHQTPLQPSHPTPHQTPLQPSHPTPQAMHPHHLQQMTNGMVPQPMAQTSNS